MAEFIKDQKKISVNIDDDLKKLFNRVGEHFGYDSQTHGITDVVIKSLKTVDERFDPKASKKEDVEKIKQLESEIELLNETDLSINRELEAANKEVKELNGIIKEKDRIIQELQEEITKKEQSKGQKINELADLEADNINLQKTIQDLHSQLNGKIHITENQIILNFSEVQLQYLKKLASYKKFIAFIKEANKEGKLNQIIEPLINDNESLQEDIGRALKGWLFYSAKLGKYPLISFDQWLKNYKPNKN